MSTGAPHPVGTTQPPDGGHRVGSGAGLRALALIALAALGLVAIRDLGGDRGAAKPPPPSAAAARSEAPASPASTALVSPKRATVALLVRDERDRPVPEAVVDVLSAGGRTFDPPAAGVTDADGRVLLSVPDGGAQGHRVEVRPRVLWAPADGAAQVVPGERVGPWLAGEPEASVRGWYPTRVESWRAPWPVVRVRSWVRAHVTVHSAAPDPKAPSMPAPGVRVAVRLDEGDPNEFLRVTTTGADGEASFWLWTPDPVTVLALANAADRASDETSVSLDAPRGELLLRDNPWPHHALPEALEADLERLRRASERARRILDGDRERGIGEPGSDEWLEEIARRRGR